MSRKELISKSRFVIIEGQQVAKLKKVWPLNCLVYLNWTMNAFKPLGGPEIFVCITTIIISLLDGFCPRLIFNVIFYSRNSKSMQEGSLKLGKVFWTLLYF